jgi:3-oxoacyl-[acyl-carrier protein] reductase
MDTGLQGKTAIVPGSTSGLGEAVARSLAAEGANVVVAGRRGERARSVARELGSAVGVEVDLADPDAPHTLVEAAREHFGEVDVLVLNSGGPPPGDAAAMDEESLRQALEVLLLRQRSLVDLVLPQMRESGWGRVVAIGSGGVQQPIVGLALSNVARAGLAAYLKSLAPVVAPDGVTVNMVLPGRIATDRLDVLDSAAAQTTGEDVAEVRRRSQAGIPAGRYGTPQEFAAVVTFLCSTAASYVTGEQVRCDGGMTAGY